jgi:uncharacterized protein
MVRRRQLHIAAFSGLIVALGLFFWPSAQASGESVSSKPPLNLMRFGETSPMGWMLNQMQADLKDGLAGHYTEISDTVNKRRFETRTADRPGDNGEPGWWAGEHEGYYADGLFRLAWLAGGLTVKKAAIARLESVLTSQDSDGYIGVYPDARRLSEQDPNDGELWTQSRMFQALLAWYEATSDARILQAVDKAAKRTLAAYRHTGYFNRSGVVGGGVSHGVGFSDTLEWLYRLTGDDVYRTGYLWLYGDYAASNVNTDELMPANLSDTTMPWLSHTPHIVEGLSMPAIAFAYGGPASYGQAADQVLEKLRRHSNPGGGPIGDESVLGRTTSFDLNSEYCSMTETISSLNRLSQFRDPMATAEFAERIALNSAQGARLHTAATAISYLTADNRLSAIQTATLGDRPLYSASHLSAACCSLNSTRLLPYYLEGMWLRQSDGAGLVARLYGPSLLDTKIQDVPVHIFEDTSFPFTDKITFTVSPSRPVSFKLTLRIPEYAKKPLIFAPGRMHTDSFTDRVEISGMWKAGDVVKLTLGFDVHRMQDSEGETGIAYGPLLYSLPIEAKALPGRITRSDTATSTLMFRDTEYVPSDNPTSYLIPRSLDFKSISLPDGDTLDPWNKPPYALEGSLLKFDGTRVSVRLKPLGSTLLRITGMREDQIFVNEFGS